MAKPGRTVIPTALLRLSRRPDRVGRLAKLAIHIIIETQHRAGPCPIGNYTVMAERGSCVTSYRALADVIDGKPETASRMLAEICGEVGWDAAILGTDDTVERWRDYEGGTRRCRGRYIGVYITVCNYDDLQRFGGDRSEGNGGGGEEGQERSIPTPYPSPHPDPRPNPIHRKKEVELRSSPSGAPDPRKPRAAPPDETGSMSLDEMREGFERERAAGRGYAALGVLRHMAQAGNDDAAQVLREQEGT